MFALAFLQATEVRQPLWHILIDNVLALTILLIFLAAAIGAVTRLRANARTDPRRDDARSARRIAGESPRPTRDNPD